jgi:enoyl-CoA hydratase
MPYLNYETKTINGGVVVFAQIEGIKELNLIDQTIAEECKAILDVILTLKDLRCIFLSGITNKAFIGGADLNALGILNQLSADRFITSIHNLCYTIRSAKVPIVAVMSGYCLGAGLELAVSCDFRIADNSVRCGMPEVRVGVPSVVEAALLPGIVGWGKARELMLRGNIIDAHEALAIGLVEHVVKNKDLHALVNLIASDIVGCGPEAIASQKALFLKWENETIDNAITEGVECFVDAYRTSEPREMIQKFFNK